MKVLVSWMRELRHYVSREFYLIMQDLICIHGWRQVEPDILRGEPAEALRTLMDVAGGPPEAVLFWETYALSIHLHRALRAASTRTYLFADDLHQLWGREADREQKLRAFSLCDAVLSPYAYRFHKFYPELAGGKRVEWIPHCASADFALPFNPCPENTILLSGAGGSHYPLRGHLKDLQEAGHRFIVHQNHPGYQGVYDHDHDPRVGIGYAQTIQQHVAAFTDASVYRYLVAKYFEIPATGALLFADISVAEQLAELGFCQGVHYVGTSAADVDDRIDFVVNPSHREEIDEIRQRGQQLAQTRHRTCDRALLIDRACSTMQQAD